MSLPVGPGNKLPINTDTVLILERAFESQAHGQKAIENCNIIEQVLIEIVNFINVNCDFKSEFIIRRLPTYMIPFVNKNEYGIVLENFDFNLSTPRPSVSESTTSIDGSPVRLNFSNTVEVNGPMYSQEIFKRFAAAFVKGFAHINETENHIYDFDVDIQIIGSQLLQQLRMNPEIPKIFKLTQSSIPINSNKISKIKIHIDELKTSLKVELEGTGVRIFPCLFVPFGYSTITNNLLERLPMYHPAILTIGESLTKGCLLFPTNFESLWTIQSWPSESHIISKFHPNSIIGRVFKLYGSVCVNPIYFWETLNTSFLIGIESKTYSDNNLFSIDFLISSFLHELEKLPNITDWEPELFSTRLTAILEAAVVAYEKGFHFHYFTKANVLRGIWKRNFEVRSPDEEDDIEIAEACRRSVSPDIEANYERECDYTMEDDFGLHFEDLGLDDDDEMDASGTPKRKFTFDSVGTTRSEEASGKKSKSISKFIGRTILRRFSMAEDERPKSALADIASGFEGAINLERKRGGIEQSIDDVFTSGTSRQALAETSFNTQGTHKKESTTYDNKGFVPTRDSIYALIVQLLDEIAPANYLSDTELITYLDNCRKVLNSQNELIQTWNTMLNTEIPKPKNICPHSFNPRQLEYISLIMKILGKCLAQNNHPDGNGMPSWEISGDILRIVLCQLRIDTTSSSTSRQRKSKLKGSKSFTLGSSISKLSFRSRSRSGSYDVCKSHSTELDNQLPLESPETSTTHRLLQWLWQLRNSEIGKLSNKAKNYLETLYSVSMTNSHFLEQFNEERAFESTALRSAVAVSRILADTKFPPHIPLLTASQRGWLWAEMILSLVSWNKEKGLTLKSKVPKFMEEECCSSDSSNFLVRDIHVVGKSSLKTRGQDVNANFPPPDPEAITLAFHSELATPLGWNDLEDPRRPGPFTVPILIFTNQYFNSFEMSIGNIVQVMMRIQKFSLLQHVATMLNPPHRKTALNEIRKLSKSTSFRIPQFDENVMSKTFKRLASLRNTGRAYFRHSRGLETRPYTCEQVGCNEGVLDGITRVYYCRGKNIECTKL